MNQTQSSTLPRSKTYEITITALMTAVTCILAPMSIPIGPVPISFTNLAIYLSLYLLGWKRGTISYLIYLLIGLVGLPVFSGFTGGPAKLAGLQAIYHRIYRNGNYCRTGHRQLPQTMASAYRYDRRNHCMLPFRNHMVLRGRRLYFPGSPRSLRHPVYSGRPGKNDYRDAHWTDDKEKNTVIAAVAKVLCKHGL